MKALLCKCMLLSMWLAVHMAYGATASVVSFTASEPDENGSVQLDWVVTGSPYAGGIRFNVAVSRSETNDLMTSTIITGAYMDQRNSVRGSLVDTPPVAGKTYYYWLNCAPYNFWTSVRKNTPSASTRSRLSSRRYREAVSRKEMTNVNTCKNVL